MKTSDNYAFAEYVLCSCGEVSSLDNLGNMGQCRNCGWMDYEEIPYAEALAVLVPRAIAARDQRRKAKAALKHKSNIINFS